MRVTDKVKQQTRRRLIDVARKLFQTKGFQETSTRDISGGAGIATGTLFNYFPTKEHLALTIVADDLAKARADFAKRRRVGEGLAEALFSHVACGLGRLAPHRSWVTQVMEGTLGPLAPQPEPESPGDRVRLEHLQTVRALITDSELSPAPVSIQMYWTLYLGLLAFWSRDASSGQEDTLIVLDESLALFVRSLSPANDQLENENAPHNCGAD
ncbi:MAG: TetR/AcrR family transcriptional regulator [Planctomycetota bacterium]|jgi:AcrR family transcriptional regulator